MHVDVSGGRIKIQDAQTSRPIEFHAQPDLLVGIVPGDRVMIRYREEGKRLVAQEIKKLQE